jgi:phytoene desaturase
VIIGGGIGGLALAVRLQAVGVQTTILERRAELGGRAYALEDAGYRFDMGPSSIAAPGLVEDVFFAAGRQMADYLSLHRLDPYYRVFFHDGSFIDYVGDADRMKQQMSVFNADDASRYEEFLRTVRPIYDALIPQRLGSRSFDSIGAVIPALPLLWRLGPSQHVPDVVDRYFSDFRHRFLFSFHPLFIGGNPFRTPALYLMIPYLEREGDVWYPAGGIYMLVRALHRLFEELGGETRTGVEVTRICVESGRAVGVDTGRGEHQAADLVVSNADVGHTYRDLLAPRTGRHWTPWRLHHLHYSMSCFILYLGVRRKYPQLKHHTLIVSEHYRELLASIFDEQILPANPSLWLHMPTATDPSMAPDGCESLHVIVPVPNAESRIEWDSIASAFADRILGLLETWGLENLRRDLDVMHTFTPADFESELKATQGSAFSLDPRLTQTGWFRPHSRSEDARGLYLVGAGTHPGAGIPAVLLSASAAYSCIAADYGLLPGANPERSLTARITVDGTERSASRQ